jgi:hypothetical protein
LKPIVPATIAAALTLATLEVPAAGADEFTDVIDSALLAYSEGDISGARSELDYAMKLLTEIKSASLAGYLPSALPGWTREAAEADGAGTAMAMLGGGTAAAATYKNDDGDLTITLIANSPMVNSIGGMLTGMASLAGGKPMRIHRTQFVDNDGQMQGVVDGRVLVSVSGEASLESKKAYLEAMDFAALRTF